MVTNPGSLTNAAGDDVEMQTQASDSTNGSLLYTVSGLPGGLYFNPYNGYINGTIPASDVSTTPYTVTISANDGTNSGSTTFAWTISAAAGTISSSNPGGQTTTEGTTIAPLSIDASDSTSGATVHYLAIGLPPGLAINPTTGIITGTISLGAGYEGPYNVSVVANDGTNSVTQSFTWNVFSPITIGQLADQTNTENDGVSLAITASDTVSGATVSYAALGLPPGLAIDPTSGVISGVVARDAAAFGPYSVTVIAQDGTYSTQMVFSWNVNSPLTFTTPADQTNNESDVVSLAVSATNAISSSTVVYSGVGLPGGLSINPSTGVISGTVAVGDAGIGSFSPTIIANDGTYYTTTTFNWTINGAVTFNDPGDQANTVGDTVSLLVNASDTNTGGTVAYAAQGLPAGLSINTSTGLISGTVSSGAASIGTYVTTVFASDGTSSSSDTFDWTITASGTVTLATPSNQTSTEGTAISTLALSTSDSTSGATVHFFGEGLPPGLVLNPSTGAITGTPAIGDAAYSPYTVTVFASDGGAFAQETFTWSITDPVAFTAVAADQSSAEGATPTATFGASDASSGTVKYTAVGLPPGLSMNPATGAITGSVALGAAAVGSYNVTVTANNGTYSASETLNWAVASPMTLTVPTSESSTEGGSVSVSPSASDASLGTVTFAALGLPQGLSVNSSTGAITGTVAVGASGIGAFTYTLVASDGTYSAAQTETWTVANPITILAVEQSFNAEQAFAYQVQTIYTGSDTLNYAATGLPPGVTINARTGLITGTPDYDPAMRGVMISTLLVTNGAYTARANLTFETLGDPEKIIGTSMDATTPALGSLLAKAYPTLASGLVSKKDEARLAIDPDPNYPNPVPGLRGGALWPISWTVHGPKDQGGWVVQHVTIILKTKNAKGDIVEPISGWKSVSNKYKINSNTNAFNGPYVLDYWEAWYVSPNANTPSPEITFPGGGIGLFRLGQGAGIGVNELANKMTANDIFSLRSDNRAKLLCVNYISPRRLWKASDQPDEDAGRPGR